MPEGMRWRTYFRPSTITVWPALWPPLKRATTCTRAVSRSTTLPLPSSPHWAPAITMFGTVFLERRKQLLGGRAEGQLGLRLALHERVAALGELGQVGRPQREEPALRE